MNGMYELLNVDIVFGCYLRITTIEDSVFSFCSGLTSVIIPNSVITIGRYGFFFMLDQCDRLLLSNFFH